jgi:two-component system, OmpR family, response regulator
VKLLVIEDDAALRRGLVQGLRKQGFAIDAVESAEAAEDLFAISPYDLLILDLGLPGADGSNLLRRLRDRGDTVPVLVLTARGGLADRVAGLDAGADDYLRKPFSLSELAARIRAVLRRGTLVASTTLRVGDVELDPSRREVTRRGAAIALTAKEFSILEYLMRHAGTLVTRTMLLEHCWDEGYEGLSNLVDVHVGRVRRKLEAAGGSAGPLLRTVRGAGFLFGNEAP